MTMKTSILLALGTASLIAASTSAQAQDMKNTPQSVMQPSAQSEKSVAETSSYGGSMAGTRSSGASAAWDVRTNAVGAACTTGLSCNIYQGQ
jgi:hypothetical protein